MSYPLQPQQGQPVHMPQGQNLGQNVGTARQNDPRAYQPRTVQPQVRVEQPMTSAPTLGQYFRSDTRGVPGARRPRWAGLIAFWLGLLSIPLLFVVGGIFQVREFWDVAAAFSVVAVFFGLVAFVAGFGRALGFFGILFALIGNVYVLSWLGFVDLTS
jgi:hypothetical protein